MTSPGFSRMSQDAGRKASSLNSISSHHRPQRAEIGDARRRARSASLALARSTSKSGRALVAGVSSRMIDANFAGCVPRCAMSSKRPSAARCSGSSSSRISRLRRCLATRSPYRCSQVAAMMNRRAMCGAWRAVSSSIRSTSGGTGDCATEKPAPIRVHWLIRLSRRGFIIMGLDDSRTRVSPAVPSLRRSARALFLWLAGRPSTDLQTRHHHGAASSSGCLRGPAPVLRAPSWR